MLESKIRARLEKALSEIKGIACITGKEEFPDWFQSWVVDYKHTMFDWNVNYLPERKISLNRQARFMVGMHKHKQYNVIVTQSPFIISDFPKENVLIIDKNKISHPEFQTFGSSINRITMCIFDLRCTMGDYSLSILKEYDKRLKAGEDPDEIINESYKIFGDSVERTIFINNCLNAKEKLEGIMPEKKDGKTVFPTIDLFNKKKG
jgi:hypothetical protein